MDKRTKDIVYAYWMRNEIGQKMILSDSVSDSDLLFLIPNNTKRRLGLPPTRIAKKRKSKYKRNLKRRILGFGLFDIISEIVEDTVQKGLSEEYFYQFIDIKDVEYGDKHQFVSSAETYGACSLLSVPLNNTRQKLEKALFESMKG